MHRMEEDNTVVETPVASSGQVKQKRNHRGYGLEVAKVAVDAVFKECEANEASNGNFKCTVRQVWKQLVQDGYNLPCSTLYDIYRRVLKAHADKDQGLGE